jgi:hypothetical protein
MKRLFQFALGLLALPCVCAAASVALNNHGTIQNVSGHSVNDTTNMSVTAGGSNVVAFFPVMWDDTSGGAITAISYNGVSILSNVACGPAGPAPGDNGYVEVFYYINPPTGTKTLAITGNSSVNEIYYNIVSFTGVNQTTPVRSGTCQTAATSTGSGKTASLTITSNTSDLTMSAIDVNLLSSTNQTSDGITTAGILAAGSDHATTAASSVTHTWTTTATGQDYAMVGFSIEAAGGNAYVGNMSETNTASDSLARSAAFGRSDTETNTASDALARAGNFLRADAETNTASDALARVANYGRGPSETNTVSDGVARLGRFGRGDTETNAATDALGRMAGFARAATETNAASDALARVGEFGRGDTETNVAADALGRVGNFARADAETNTAGDLISALRPGKPYTATLNELLSFSDALGRRGNFARTDTETNTASAALGRTANFGRAPAEQNTASDALARMAALRRQNQEAEVVSDFLARTLAANRGTAELLVVTDVLGERWTGRLIILPRHTFATPGQRTSEAAPGQTTAGSATNTLKSGSAPATAKTGTAPASRKAGSAPQH